MKTIPITIFMLVAVAFLSACSFLSIPQPNQATQEITQPPNIEKVTKESHDLSSLFTKAKEMSQKNPSLGYIVESYAPGCQGICVLPVYGLAKDIAEIGEDFVCFNDVKFDNTDIVDVCYPYSAIVRIRFDSTMFP